MTHIHTEDRNGFKIDFYAVEDFQDVRGQFEDEDAAEIIAQLEAGDLVQFTAKVTASKNGIELASDYLGGCFYKDEKDFVNNEDYYGDMVQTVIEEAKQAIIALNEDINNDN